MGLRLASEQRRKLPTVKYVPGSTVSVKIPTDTAIKRMIVRLVGSTQCTYTGSPVASPQGYLGRLCNRVSIVANGRDTIKNLNPYMSRCLQLLNKGVAGNRSFSLSASAPTSLIAGTERVQGPAFDYPATTEYLVLNETMEINFEHPLAYGQGKQASIFYTKNLSSAEMTFDFAPIERLQQDGGAVSVAYANANFDLEITIIESQSVEEDPKNKFLLFKEVHSVQPIGGQVSDLSFKLTRGNNLTGLSFLALNGDSNQSLSDAVIKNLKVLFNSREPVQECSWRGLQDDNRMRYGVDAWKTSGNHPQKGFAHMNFMQYGLAATGLPTQAFNELELRIDSAASTGVDAATYTVPAQLMVVTHELVQKAS